MGPAATREHEVAPPLQPADSHEEVEEPIIEVEPERAAAPVIEAEAIEEPDDVIEVPTAAVAVPAGRVEVREAPAARVPDALAPIMALSAEEKIALFT